MLQCQTHLKNVGRKGDGRVHYCRTWFCIANPTGPLGQYVCCSRRPGITMYLCGFHKVSITPSNGASKVIISEHLPRKVDPHDHVAGGIQVLNTTSGSVLITELPVVLCTMDNRQHILCKH